MMSFWVVPASEPCTRRDLGLRGRRVDAGLLLGDHLVERQQPHRGGVDGHRGVHRRRAGCRRRAGASHRGAAPGRRPCRPRRGPAGGRGRSRSGSAGRRPPTAPSGPWPGCGGRARWTPRPSCARRTSGSARGCPASAAGLRSCPAPCDESVMRREYGRGDPRVTGCELVHSVDRRPPARPVEPVGRPSSSSQRSDGRDGRSTSSQRRSRVKAMTRRIAGLQPRSVRRPALALHAARSPPPAAAGRSRRSTPRRTCRRPRARGGRSGRAARRAPRWCIGRRTSR